MSSQLYPDGLSYWKLTGEPIAVPFLWETRPKKWVGDGAAGRLVVSKQIFHFEDGGALGVSFGVRG
jgi:hypothetical protein